LYTLPLHDALPIYTETLPSDGRMSPVMTRRSVVLPAPFGPSRPVMPGPNEHDTSDTATFVPNHFDTPCTITVGCVVRAGSRAGAGASVVAIRTPSGTGGARSRR